MKQTNKALFKIRVLVERFQINMVILTLISWSDHSKILARFWKNELIKAFRRGSEFIWFSDPNVSEGNVASVTSSVFYR